MGVRWSWLALQMSREKTGHSYKACPISSPTSSSSIGVVGQRRWRSRRLAGGRQRDIGRGGVEGGAPSTSGDGA